jgi:hypothetical protein
VTVVTAAPAYANASGQLSVASLVASHVPDQPEQVAVSATVTGFGESYQLILTVPPGVFDSVGSDTAMSPASTGLGTSHTITFTGTSSDFHAVLDLGSRTELPWRGFQGGGFTVTAVAGADGRQSPSSTTAVAAYPMPGAMLNGDVDPTASLTRVASGSIASHYLYPGVIGSMVVVVAIERLSGVTKPDVSKTHRGWTYLPEVDESDFWLYRFVTKQTHHTSRTGLSQNPDRGPAPDGGGYYEFWADLAGMPDELVGCEARFFYSIDGDTAARIRESRTISA